ncbi:MAG: hypothetical protein ACI8PT_000886, partial [Gammaproteobacteria bacterium]
LSHQQQRVIRLPQWCGNDATGELRMTRRITPFTMAIARAGQHAHV